MVDKIFDGKEVKDLPPLPSLTGRVVLQILEKAETVREQTLERVEQIALDWLPGGPSFEAFTNDPQLEGLGLGDLSKEILDEYAVRLRERFRLECDSGRRSLPQFATKND